MQLHCCFFEGRASRLGVHTCTDLSLDGSATSGALSMFPLPFVSVHAHGMMRARNSEGSDRSDKSSQQGRAFWNPCAGRIIPQPLFSCRLEA